ncbi:hypothetical protein [Bacillus rhizoplanae]|uniref:hypothetical protein n=1 Tax=Bacillus rhizoplanae TaxID=2880966 RepID=UPI003D208A73
MNWGLQVQPNPVVHISVCEGFHTELPSDNPLNFIHPEKATHTMFIKNVVPTRNSDGTLHVEFYLHIDSPNPVNVCVDITVVEPAVEGFIIG